MKMFQSGGGAAGGVRGFLRPAVVIGNGFAGAENQCFGLLRALGLSSRFSLHRVTRPPGRLNSCLRWLPLPLHKKMDSILTRIYSNSSFLPLLEPNKLAPSPGSAGGTGTSPFDIVEADAKQIAAMARDTYEKDGPLLVVASGRDTISVASSIKRLATDSVFVVQIQHPRTKLDRFDLVITPRHDYYPLTPEVQKQIPWFLRRWISPREPPGDNVVLTVGALHQADFAALECAASVWRDELEHLPKPLLIVNIGGPTKNCQYGTDLAQELTAKLQNVFWSCGSVRISFSRRTPAKVSELLINQFSANPKVYIWDGEGPNPHMGHLAFADAFVITADSVSMLSEACSTGKPVYVIGAERCTWKFADFQKSLRDRGIIRTFTGKEDISKTWSYPPLQDAAEAAGRVIEAIANRRCTIHT